MKDIQNNGQASLWKENFNNQIIDDEDIKKKIILHTSNYSCFTRLNVVLADFFMKNGPVCSTKNIKDVYKDLEHSGKIDVKRDPEFTEKISRPSRFFADEKGKKTELRWLS
jgi:hypothetical protein